MLFLLLFVLVFALLMCGILNGYLWWRASHMPKAVYWIATVLSIGVSLFTVTNVKRIPSQLLKELLLLFSVLVLISLLYGSILFVVRSILLLLAAKLHWDNAMFRFLRNRKKIVPVFLCFTILLGIVGYINAGIIRQTNYTIRIDKHAAEQSLCVAVISDMHIGVANQKSDIDFIVTSINQMKVDAVFLVGDIFDESTTRAEMLYFQRAFATVKSVYGTYAVLGNHEGYQQEDTTHYLTDAGITLLQDEAVTIGTDITLIGLRDYYDSESKPIAAVLSDEQIDYTKPLILLKHEPLALMECAEAGIDLSFSGHTHSEQAPLIKPFVAMANDMVYGMESFGTMTAITSAGTGCWGIPFKFPAKSEIVKATILFD